MGCVNVTCRPGEFVCNDHSRCLPAVWRCDGKVELGSDSNNDAYNLLISLSQEVKIARMGQMKQDARPK